MRLLPRPETSGPTTGGATARPAAPSAWFRAAPAQRTLLVASLAIMVAAFLPWVTTPVGDLPGLEGGGVLTLYAASLGVAGALVRRAWLAAAQGVVAGAVALGVAGWQLVRVLELDAEGLGIGTGVVVTVLAGVFCLRAALAVHLQARGLVPEAGAGAR